FYCYMKTSYFTLIALLLHSLLASSQTKIGGKVLDPEGQPMAYANIIFLNSHEGTITDENGKFYIESKETYDAVECSFTGTTTVNIPLDNPIKRDIEIVLKENAEELGAVQIFKGKTSKKNNPAIDILKKIWANKRKNGVYLYDQYEFDKYEKLEFDINSID